MADGDRAPELPQDAGADLECLSLGPAPKRHSRLAALHEQRPANPVMGKNSDGTAAIPVQERIRLVLALGLREVDLEHGRRPVGKRDP